jgi:hypothetical protein
LQRMVRSLVAVSLALALAGCSGPSKSKQLAGPKADGTKTTKPINNKIGKAAVKPSKPGAIGFAKCEAGPCMYHRGGNTYHECLSANAGMCFHYGRTCAPSDKCMLERASGTYKACAKLGECACLQFGAACEPKDGCMLDPKDNVYRTCESASAGTCQRFGAVCLPG